MSLMIVTSLVPGATDSLAVESSGGPWCVAQPAASAAIARGLIIGAHLTHARAASRLSDPRRCTGLPTLLRDGFHRAVLHGVVRRKQICAVVADALDLRKRELHVLRARPRHLEKRRRIDML